MRSMLPSPPVYSLAAGPCTENNIGHNSLTDSIPSHLIKWLRHSKIAAMDVSSCQTHSCRPATLQGAAKGSGCCRGAGTRQQEYIPLCSTLEGVHAMQPPLVRCLLRFYCVPGTSVGIKNRSDLPSETQSLPGTQRSKQWLVDMIWFCTVASDLRVLGRSG